jgi:hypothetical protein
MENGTGLDNAPSRRWCFTLNNPQHDLDLDVCADIYIRYLVFQSEISSTGTNHYQGYIECSRPQRFSAFSILGLTGAHFEPARGTPQECIAYCTKEDTRVDGPYHYGIPPTTTAQGKRNDLLEVKAKLDGGSSLRDISDAHFGSFLRYHKGLSEYSRLHSRARDAEAHVVVHWGLTGAGKSTKAFADYPDNYSKPVDSHWFDSYNGESAIIFDEFTGSKWFSAELFKSITDNVPGKKRLVQTKGSSVYCTATTLVFISNEDPRTWFAASHWDQVKRRVHEWNFWTGYRKYITAPTFEGVQEIIAQLGVQV